MRRLEIYGMPKQVFDTKEFLALAEDAISCIIKKNDGQTKLKLRTNRYLYTIVMDSTEAKTVLGKIQCPTEEI
jgi:hypothetical protein